METALEGGRVLTTEPDQHHCWMQHKHSDVPDYQLWRLEANGCLRNKKHMDKCLGLETHTTGGGVYLQADEGLPSQQWWFVQQARTTLRLHQTYIYHFREVMIMDILSIRYIQIYITNFVLSYLVRPRVTASGWPTSSP